MTISVFWSHCNGRERAVKSPGQFGQQFCDTPRPRPHSQKLKCRARVALCQLGAHALQKINLEGHNQATSSKEPGGIICSQMMISKILSLGHRRPHLGISRGRRVIFVSNHRKLLPQSIKLAATDIYPRKPPSSRSPKREMVQADPFDILVDQLPKARSCYTVRPPSTIRTWPVTRDGQ
jgi:hypothetical protein